MGGGVGGFKQREPREPVSLGGDVECSRHVRETAGGPRKVRSVHMSCPLCALPAPSRRGRGEARKA